MIHKIYSIYDSKSEAYSLPFYYQHEGQATRTFSDWVNDPQTPYGKHPEDYTMFAMGTYDEITGSVTQDKITSVVNGLSLVQDK